MVVIKKLSLIALLSALLYCHCAYATSEVHLLFNGYDFLDEDQALLSEEFWSTPKNVLYGKSVADWTDEDFSELETEVKNRIFFLYSSDSPFREDIIEQFKKVLVAIPEMKEWSAYTRLNLDIASQSPGQEGASVHYPQDDSWFGFLDRDLPLVPTLAVLALLGGNWAAAWWYFRKKRGKARAGTPLTLVRESAATVGDATLQADADADISGSNRALPIAQSKKPANISSKAKSSEIACPKCKNTDITKITVGQRVPDSSIFNPKRKYYCHACDYKWIGKG